MIEFDNFQLSYQARKRDDSENQSYFSQTLTFIN